MARNTGKGKGFSKNPRDWKEISFVQINMSEADKAHFKEEYASNANELLDAVVTMVEQGYKLSVTWDTSNNCFIASLTCRDETDENFNLCLSSRSSDMWQAVSLGAFKHLNLTKNGSWPTEKPENNFG